MGCLLAKSINPEIKKNNNNKMRKTPSLSRQVWISQADTLLTSNEMKHKVLHDQVLQISAHSQSLVSRSELDASMGSIAGSARRELLSASDAMEARLSESDRARQDVKREVEEVRMAVDGIFGKGKDGMNGTLANDIFRKVESMMEDR